MSVISAVLPSPLRMNRSEARVFPIVGCATRVFPAGLRELFPLAWCALRTRRFSSSVHRVYSVRSDVRTYTHARCPPLTGCVCLCVFVHTRARMLPAINGMCMLMRVDRMEVHVTYVLPARPQVNEIFTGPTAPRDRSSLVRTCLHTLCSYPHICICSCMSYILS